MKKITALAIALSLLATFHSGLMAKERRGAQLQIFKKKGGYTRGELIVVKQNSLLLKASDSGVDVSVDIDEIKLIKIVKKSQAGKGALIGLFFGAAIGTAMLAAENAGSNGSNANSFYSFDIDFPAYYGAILGLPGALVGTIIGAAVGTDKTIQIEGKSDSEIKGILAILRSKARIKNYQ